jgi:Tfp pilus assembly PilM family ATPase
MTILSGLHDSAAPAAAVEISASRVAGASLEWRGAQAVVSAHASELLAEGAVVPSLNGTNLHDRAAVAAAVSRVLEQIGRPKRIGLILPDTVGRVSLVRFAQVPGKPQELEQLVRWQLKKGAPFPIDDAQVSYVPGMRGDEGHEFVVTMARRDVIEEYERLCADAGAHAGIVDLSTINVINAVLASSTRPTGDWLLVNAATGYTSVALMRGAHLIFFRNRAADTDGTLPDLVHQTVMYYEDRLKGGGFSRVLVAGASAVDSVGLGDIDAIRRSLEERLHTAVEAFDLRAAATLTDRITAAPTLLDTLTPLVGMLLRDRDEVPA